MAAGICRWSPQTVPTAKPQMSHQAPGESCGSDLHSGCLLFQILTTQAHVCRLTGPCISVDHPLRARSCGRKVPVSKLQHWGTARDNTDTTAFHPLPCRAEAAELAAHFSGLLLRLAGKPTQRGLPKRAQTYVTSLAIDRSGNPHFLHLLTALCCTVKCQVGVRPTSATSCQWEYLTQDLAANTLGYGKGASPARCGQMGEGIASELVLSAKIQHLFASLVMRACRTE